MAHILKESLLLTKSHSSVLPSGIFGSDDEDYNTNLSRKLKFENRLKEVQKRTNEMSKETLAL